MGDDNDVPLSHVILTGNDLEDSFEVSAETRECMMRVFYGPALRPQNRWLCHWHRLCPMFPPILQRGVPKVQVKSPPSPPLNPSITNSIYNWAQVHSSTPARQVVQAGHLKNPAKSHLNIHFDPKSTYNHCWVHTTKLGLICLVWGPF